MLQRIAIALGLIAFAGAAAAEPPRRPAPEAKQYQSLFPIGGLAGGLVAPRTR